jgi:hypothetical protein
MKFTLEVGAQERHQIEFEFNQLLGRSVIRVDDREVFRKNRWFSEPIVESYDVEISGHEQIRMRIVKERKLLVSSRYKVYVDNRLTQLYQGA